MADKKKTNDGRHAANDAHADSVGAKVQGAYSAALDGASDAVRGAASGIEANPVAALLGGLALGAAAGALIARGEKEKALLAPLGEKLNGAARAALEAGRAAGRDAISDAGLDVDGLREQAAKLFGQARDAATTVGTAAFSAARDDIRS